MSYNRDFFALEGSVAARSAALVVPWVLEQTGAHSVIDVGCGTGAWLLEARDAGREVFGVDGHVPADLLLISEEYEFEHADLTGGFDCSGYDLAICTEVAEHLPAVAAVPLVVGLAGARAVLFSGATPGQPGIGHINCQPHDYWHRLFALHGLRPEFVGDLFDEPVADFYRRNLYLYR